MLVNKLRELAKLLGWMFNYGAEEWQNLIDLEGENPVTHFLLLWKDRAKNFNDYNAIESIDYNGEFILAERSDFNQTDYNDKYAEHISKMEAKLDVMCEQINACDSWQVLLWQEVEVSNVLDTNVDGIKVKFKFRYNEN